MTGDVVMTNGMTYAAGGSDILNGLLADIIEQDKISYAYQEGLKSAMFFTETKALNPEQTFSEAVGAYETDQINEGQSLPIIDVEKGPNKGFKVIPYGNKLKITKLFMEWLKTGKTIATADSWVQSYFQKLASATINLNRGAIKRYNLAMIEVLTKGWLTTSANGAGSPTAYGQPLFSAAHPIMGGTAVMTNTLSMAGMTPNDNLSATSLQRALDVHKTGIQLQNGDFVENNAGIYELRVPRALEQVARAILNQAGSAPSQYAGTGSNANLLNTFTFNGNTVKLKVLPTLGGVDKNGTTIGAATYWFVVNPEAMQMVNGFRLISLWDRNVESHYDFDTKNYFASIDFAFGVEHIGAQYCIVGSQGTA